ncbi:MAG: sigma-70 family RNA polymerase sigma factor [Planctomycetia bacterium]|nr:sigma-70 family RNA polymerase sigma factor [Planctomycetia bacterium]
MGPRHADTPLNSGQPLFATTQWSVVLAAGAKREAGAREALTRLCEVYWPPLYAYVRRRIDDVHEAQDLTQAFFSHLIEKHTIGRAQRDRGRFRAFLLTALKNFLANEWHKARTDRRGGGRAALSLDFAAAESRLQIEPSHELTPEKVYERRWVLTLLDNVLEALRLELAQAGKLDEFEQFKSALTGEMSAADYDRAADALGITSAAAKQAAYRMRKRYRGLFRDAVAQTVAAGEDLDEEIGRLQAILE